MKLKTLFTLILIIIFGKDKILSQGWQQIHPDYPVTEITSILHWKGDTVYASGNDWTLMRSDNAGVTWKSIFGRDDKLLDINFAETNGNVLFLWIIPKPYQQSIQKYFFNTDQEKYLFTYNPCKNDTSRIIIKKPSALWGVWDIYDISANKECLSVLVNEKLPPYRAAILFSNDEGKNWITQFLPDTFLVATGSLSFRTRKNGLIIAKTPGLIEPYLFMTNDGGLNWNQTSVNYIDHYSTQTQLVKYPLEWETDSVAVIAHSNLISFTRDQGKTWTTLPGLRWSCSGKAAKLSSVHFLPNGIGYVSSEGRGVLKTTDWGANWVQVKYCEEISGLNCEAIVDSNILILGSIFGNFYRTADGGLSWDNINSSDFSIVTHVHFFNNKEGYIAADDILYFTSDAGKSLTMHVALLPLSRSLITPTKDIIYSINAKDSLNRVLAVRLSTDGSFNWNLIYVWPGIDSLITDTRYSSYRGTDTLFYTTTRGLLKTYDRGKTWQVLPDIITKGCDPILFLDMKSQTTGWAGSQYAVFRTTDDGLTWQKIVSPDSVFRLMDLDVVNKSKVVATFAMKYATTLLFKTTDGGNTWSKYTVQFDPGLMNSFYFDSDKSYCVNGTGLIWTSSDYWQTATNQFYQSTKFSSIFQKTFFLNEQNGWIVGRSGFILHTESGGIDIVKLPSEINSDIYLNQNYPNPVTPNDIATTISYTISGSVDKNVLLELYDILGRKVKTIYQGIANTGTHSYYLQTESILPGVYIIRLATNKAIQIKKMTVVK